MSGGSYAAAAAMTAGLLMLGPAARADATRLAATPAASTDQRTLSAVSCPGTHRCWAVGMAEQGAVTGAFSERWNGSTWKVVAVPRVSLRLETTLTGISCASPANCWAVGFAQRNLGIGKQEPIAEHWQGKKWSPQILPKPKGHSSAGLSGVSCPAATRCWAVGFTNAGSAFAEHWNGKRWSTVPDALPAFGAALTSVSCVSDANCWAAGTRNGRPLAEHWQGRAWSVAATSAKGGFDAISCLRAACMAAGFKSSPFGLAERWNGSKWLVTAAPDPAGARFSVFRGVACRTSSACFMVGYYETRQRDFRAIIERWQHSAWTIVKSPEPPGRGLAVLNGVSCQSVPCWTVGFQQNDANASSAGPLAERSNGAHWSVVRTP